MTLNTRESLRIVDSPYDPAHTLPEPNKVRYHSLIQHNKPLISADAAFYISHFTQIPKRTIQDYIADHSKIFVTKGHVERDAFLYLYDLFTQSKLLQKWGWYNPEKQNKGLSFRHTLVMDVALSRNNLASVEKDLRAEIDAAYPKLKGKLKPSPKDRIPDSFLERRLRRYISNVDRVGEGMKIYGLSPTEYAVLLLVVRGHNNSEIAKFLNESVNTVKNHTSALLSKLNGETQDTISENDPTEREVIDRTNAALKAMEEGLIPHSVLDTSITSDKIAKLKQLSDRQIKVIQLVAKGYTNQVIGDILSVGRQSVKYHLTKIFKILGCRSRLDVALLYHLSYPTADCGVIFEG